MNTFAYWLIEPLAIASGARHIRTQPEMWKDIGPVFSKIFTWWNSSTIGASFDIKRRSDFIGTDDYGNKYYQDRKAFTGGRKKRYVIYNGLAEPSKVPAEWHGWLHHAVDTPPTEAPLARREWETDHKPNMTGTVFAYKPTGSLSREGERQAAPGDYEAWDPDA